MRNNLPNLLAINGLNIYILALFAACSKVIPDVPVTPAPTRLSTKLTVTPLTVRDEEGKSLSWNMTLDQPLAKAVELKVNINTSNYKTNYANPEDYMDPEYSYDNGATWIASANDVVEIPSPQTSIQVRIRLAEDGAPEILEEKSQVSFTHNNPSVVGLEGYVPEPFETTVTDTDVTPTQRKSLDDSDDKISLAFDNSRGPFRLFAVSTSVRSTNEAFAIKEKQVIDGGYREVMDFVSRLMVTPVNIVRQIHLNFNPPSSDGSIRLGAVGQTIKPEEWVLYLNLYGAFYHTRTDDADDDARTGEKLPSFNSDNHFGITVIHELGHLFTLNTNEVNANVVSAAGCDGTFVVTPSSDDIPQSGRCFKQNSYGSGFISRFYDLDPTTHKADAKFRSTFVTRYARTSFAEDLAESFQYYIRTSGVPASGRPPSAQSKIAFFNEFPGGRALKEHLRMLYPNMPLLTLTPPTLAYQPNIFAYETVVDDHEGCVRPMEMIPVSEF